MRIVTITCARLVNTGNFSNTRFEATAELEEGEMPSACMATLQVWLGTVIEAERARRYPDLLERSWQNWLPESRDEQHPT